MWALVFLCSVLTHSVQAQTTWKMEIASAGAVSNCGGYLYSSSGNFMSPNYPNNYPNNLDCVWYIRPGSQIIQLDFYDVSTECRYDDIYVYDGSSTGDRLLGRFCNTSSTILHSTGSYLTVRFRTDGSIINKGFHASYRVVSRGLCKYNCGYQVGQCSCSSGCEYRGNCCSDYQTYCSSTTDTPVTAQPSCRHNCGYNMGSCSCASSCQYYGNCCHDYNDYCHQTTHRPVGPTTVSNCGGYLYSSSGNFMSPNYPNSYPNNLDCVWYIRPGSQIIQLDFYDVSTECGFDYIYVYDGSSTGDRLLGRFCNSTILHSTGSYLTVRFTTDGSVTKTGFRASYRVVSRGLCKYNCGYQVGQCSCSSGCENRGNCCSDYQTYCSSTTDTPVTAQPSCRHNCGYNMGSCSCASSCQYYGNCCHDYNDYCHQTTHRPVGPTTVSNCGGYLYGSSGNFMSPNYPNSYPNNLDCVWYIRPGSQIIQLDFYDVSTECGFDYIYVYDGSSTGDRLLGRFCNSTILHSTGSYLTVRFTTDGSVTKTGFRASYRVVSRGLCKYNCGYQVGQCSCSSGCENRGNCCSDYQTYCGGNTTVPCGGSLFGSGNFSSPNHPSYYYDNAYCVWQLRTTDDQRIFLSFTYVQLENCCYCDYIAIYDGPSVSSPLLGKVCDDNRSVFYSSSNYMTVVFRTDGSVVGRGFKADFMSSLQPSSGRVDCSLDNMNIVIEKSYLNSLGYDGHSLFLYDPHCRPQVSMYQVVFSFPLNTCGNIRRSVGDRILYTNSISAYTSTQGQITRQSHLRMNVTCLMEPDSTSQIAFIVDHGTNSSITGSGRYNTSMAFYTSSSFYEKVTQVPYKVSLNQYLYVQVGLRWNDSNLILFLDTCVASPTPFDFHTRVYYLVRDGCPVDDTYHPITTAQSVARFSFRAFQFLRASEAVYIQCKVVICPASDSNSRCRRGCSRRAARGLESEHESQTLVVGPIQLNDSEKKKEEPENQNKA
ncbi:scavenger receptor cysteine-rich domain-containing protein DMBT1 [Nothobranchius furzeri]